VAEEIHLSVVIPSYNEMVNLQKGVLDKVEHYLSKQKYSYEVIVVDDGSNDGSLEFVEDFAGENKNFRVLKNSHSGKAGAVTAGMLSAKGNLRLFTDMDQATPIEEVEKLLPFTEEGYDIVIGSRNNQRKGSPLSRQIISKGAVLLRKILVGMNEISDTQCGFKLFSKASASDLFKKLSDFHGGYKEVSGSAVTAGFDVELLYMASKSGYKVKEVPVKWLYVETRRVSPVGDTINGVIEFFRIGFNRVSGKYNL
jgi:dolichyl-phosphate beta-glucosyltransferase